MDSKNGSIVHVKFPYTDVYERCNRLSLNWINAEENKGDLQQTTTEASQLVCRKLVVAILLAQLDGI